MKKSIRKFPINFDFIIMLQTINLPLNWILLNGSLSSDDIGIVYYHWEQQQGPNKAILQHIGKAVSFPEHIKGFFRLDNSLGMYFLTRLPMPPD